MLGAAGTTAMASPAEVSTFVADVHGYLRQNITWADQKAGFVFASASAFLAYLHSHDAFRFVRANGPHGAAAALAAIAGVTLAISAVAAFATYWPRKRGRSDGLVFWSAIAGRSTETAVGYAERVRCATAAELADEKAKHAFELAAICVRKYRCVDASARFSAVGIVSAIIYCVFLQ